MSVGPRPPATPRQPPHEHEPGREPSAAARWRQRLRRPSVATGVVALLAGLLFATNAQVFAGDADRHPEDLEGLARVETARLERLERENAELRDEVASYVRRAEGDPEASAGNQLAAQAAGQGALEGPGLSVELWDAPQQTDGLAASLPPDALVVHQQDVEAVMNALWAGGAEAMTVQGHRVVSTTGVRCVGNVLHIAGHTYSPPYRIEAIGSPAKLRSALLDSPDVQTYLDYVDAVRLGWSVRETTVEAPPYAGPLTLTHARVPTGADRAA
ncbi:DUF881 domain-containing protein [Georgenia thermotolerans]|uniref:DUF881 domain-containing protein n=1 Tax=Georgenia thermotolerans TaxID=527326 RepID=A0A7J5UJW8_9MICO|nr:DUF881 domain-containing protein [Georgenia thermotolerans]KAE8762689.1 DUF881 domain-containing protein [Georgenia thermotolerans]